MSAHMSPCPSVSEHIAILLTYSNTPIAIKYFFRLFFLSSFLSSSQGNLSRILPTSRIFLILLNFLLSFYFLEILPSIIQNPRAVTKDSCPHQIAPL